MTLSRSPLCLVVLVLLGAVASAAEPTVSRHGAWHVVDTDHFQVCTMVSADESQSLADRCAKLKQELGEKWLGAGDHAWTPRCQVVLHPTSRSYLQATGMQQHTAAATTLEFEEDRIVLRRIDLRADHPDGYIDALAHEMTHVLLADRFIAVAIPRWADEGMAVMADSKERQGLHLRDFQQARRSGRALRLVELVTLDDYPQNKIATFYGQSASLVTFLVERGTPQQFVTFVQKSQSSGYDRALAEVYEIKDLATLERAWQEDLKTRVASNVR